MIGKLPELFNRDFAIGYFLPTVTFVVVSLALVGEFGQLPAALSVDAVSQVDVLVGTTIIGLASWLASVFLLATNRDILRIMEGYGRLNPTRLLGWMERRRYRKLRQSISELDEEYLRCISEGEEFPLQLGLKRKRFMEEIVGRFPDEEHWLLPTSFGNTIRAFEVYPHVMYGLDSIPGWGRLLGIMPTEYRGLLDGAKAQMDFWVNLSLLSWVALVEYAGLATFTGQPRIFWFPFAALVMALVSYARARSSAAEWGELVRSSFDVFLPELRKKLDFPAPATACEERALWLKFSQSIIYRDPKCMPDREGPQDEDED